MKISCKYCSYDILSENVNIASSVAKCHHCNSVFKFANDATSNSDHNDYKEDIPLLKRIKVTRYPSELVIEKKCFNAKYIRVTFNCVLLIAMTIWFLIDDNSSSYGVTRRDILFMCFASIVMILYLIVGYVNKTLITVGYHSLSIKHAPIPWFGYKKINLAEIKQIYCKEEKRYILDK